ncbi:hypothetical protein VTO42DRAFT_568 [Malbranchea cinnamomea]
MEDYPSSFAGTDEIDAGYERIHEKIEAFEPSPAGAARRIVGENLVVAVPRSRHTNGAVRKEKKNQKELIGGSGVLKDKALLKLLPS